MYHERIDEGTKEEAGLLGSGLFVAKEVSGHKRYFIVTAAHILNTILFDIECKGYQIGLMSKSGGAIKRLSIPPRNPIVWFRDSVNDLAIADITLAIPELERTGGGVFAVDMDPVQPNKWHPGFRTLPRIQPLMDSSLVKLNGNSLPQIVIAAAHPSLTSQVQPGSHDWIVPFVVHEGVLVEQDRKVSIQYRNANPNSKREFTVSIVSTKNGWAGMSGSAAYIMGGPDKPFLYGIVIGGNDDSTLLDVIPVAKVVKFIENIDNSPIETIIK